MTGHILIHEDDTFLSQQWSRALSKSDCSIICVERASEAIAFLEHKRFDLCIVDLIIYGTEGPIPDAGVTLVSYIRRLAVRKLERPIILGVSAHSSDFGGIPAEDLFMRLGADDFLQKPFTSQELVERVESLLRHRV